MLRAAAGLCVLLLAAAAEAATVFLTDGRRVDGRVLSATATEVQVETAEGVLHIPTQRVRRIEYGAAEEKPALEAPPSSPAAPRPPMAPPPPPRAFPPRPPRAPFHQGTNLLSFQLGGVVPLSDVDLSPVGGGRDTNGDPGVDFGIQYLYQQARHLGLGLEFGFAHRSASNSSSLLANAATSPFGDSLLFLGVLRYTFRPDQRARPYVLGAIGPHRTSMAIDATPLPGFSWSDTMTDETRRLVDDHVWGLALSARVGIDFSQIGSTILGLELGWTRLGNATYAATPDGRAIGLTAISGRIDLLTVTGHARFGF